MQPQHLITFLLAHLGVAAVSLVLAATRNRTAPGRLLLATIAVVAVLAIVVIGSLLSPGSNLLITIGGELLELQRTQCVAAMLGFCTGLPWIGLLFGVTSELSRFTRTTLTLMLAAALCGTLAAGGLMSAKDLLSSYLPNPDPLGKGGLGKSRMAVSGFEIDRPFEFGDAFPIRVTVDENDRVFISAQWGNAGWSGIIYELVLDGAEPSIRRVASNLNNPYGLATRDGDLYVSRATQYTRAVQGRLVHEKTGSVTRLRDLDGDGKYEFFDDVITGLPGAQGPDYIHQNNGIAFTPDGTLYITTGAHSSDGVTRGEWEGKILRATPDFSSVDIFAHGFRNPFGIAVLPSGDVFVTDNDVDEVDPGDELNHVIEGGHYGHPHALAGDDMNGQFQTPCLVTAQPLAGLSYTSSEQLPEEYRDCLYMVDSLKGNVFRVTLEPDGATYQAKKHAFAVIPEAVDVAIASDGTFYVVCFHSREIYRIRYVGP